MEVVETEETAKKPEKAAKGVKAEQPKGKNAEPKGKKAEPRTLRKGKNPKLTVGPLPPKFDGDIVAERKAVEKLLEETQTKLQEYAETKDFISLGRELKEAEDLKKYLEELARVPAPRVPAPRTRADVEADIASEVRQLQQALDKQPA